MPLILQDLEQKYNIELDLYDDGDYLTLSRIVVPKKERGTGVGKAAMQEIIKYADEVGKSIYLTPSTDFGATSKSRLEKFYKNLGFKKKPREDFRNRETMVRYNESIVNEAYTTDKILIFDLDDTIVVSAAKILVKDIDSGEQYELTPEEFNDYKKNPKHILNFDQFKSLEIMKAGKMIDRYFKILTKNYKKGIAIGVITARDDQDMIYNWFRYHLGFHIKKEFIWAVNDPKSGLSGDIKTRKKEAMRWFVDQGYIDIQFFDDDKNNIRLIKELDKELKDVKIKATLAKK